MNCSDNENVCSVKKENNLGYYRLHTIWRNGGFFLNVTSKDGAWRGEMTPEDVKKMSDQLGLDPETYVKQCKTALTQHDGQSNMFYTVENGCFTWKEMDDKETGIKVKKGSVRLEPANFVDTIQNFVTAALNCNKKLEKEVRELCEEKKKYVSENNSLQNKLEELIKVKDTMENDLYARFLLLLNTKKKKIEELQNKLEMNEMNFKKNISDFGKNPYDVDTESDSETELKRKNVKLTKEKSKRSSSKKESEKKKIGRKDECSKGRGVKNLKKNTKVGSEILDERWDVKKVPTKKTDRESSEETVSDYDLFEGSSNLTDKPSKRETIRSKKNLVRKKSKEDEGYMTPSKKTRKALNYSSESDTEPMDTLEESLRSSSANKLVMETETTKEEICSISSSNRDSGVGEKLTNQEELLISRSAKSTSPILGETDSEDMLTPDVQHTPEGSIKVEKVGSPKAGSSGISEEKSSDRWQSSTEMPSTKEELLDFFFG